MNPSHPAMSRARAIQRVKDRLSRDAFPRMQMALHGAQPEVARMPTRHPKRGWR